MVAGDEGMLTRGFSWPDLARDAHEDASPCLLMPDRVASLPVISGARGQGCMVLFEAADRGGRLVSVPDLMPRLGGIPRDALVRAMRAGFTPERILLIKLKAAFRAVLRELKSVSAFCSALVKLIGLLWLWACKKFDVA